MLKKIFVLIFFFFFPQIVLASADKFSTSYNITYDVKSTGSTVVTQEIGLTNLTSDYYAKEYRIRPGISNIKNISANSKGRLLNTSQVGLDKEKEIVVTFSDPVVGQNESFNFSLTFETAEIATKRGSVWEVNLPRLSGIENAQSYKVVLVADKSLGQAAYINPKPDSAASAKYGPFSWSGKTIKTAGALVGFGQAQIYNFRLKYDLVNSKLYPATAELALPMDTNYQQVFLTSISPSPDDVVLDLDGNWLARYLLWPAGKSAVLVSGTAVVYPVFNLDLADSGIEPYDNLTTPDTFWERLDLDLDTPKAIYDFAVKNLSYDESRLTSNFQRQGAARVLENKKSAICMEFTDLFIALARSAGIPAREINGYAYTIDEQSRPAKIANNPDILHAWPEYFDGQKWVMVDPTWENTTKGLDYFGQWDFNHLVFVRHGKSSTQPYPAGTYKLQEDAKTVFVEFGSTVPNRNDHLQIKTSPFVKTIFNPGPNAINYDGEIYPPFAKRVKYVNVNIKLATIVSISAIGAAALIRLLFLSRRKK